MAALAVLISVYPGALRASPKYLSDQPIWFSPTDYPTRCVAFGDLDLDGDLDFVCANDSLPITVCINENGSFKVISLELSHGSRTVAIALADIGGGDYGKPDGYFDLVCGNFGGTNTIYLNEWGNGTENCFSDSIFWESDWACQTTSVVVGDVDQKGDGYLDLVFGNVDNVNTLYLNNNGTIASEPAWSSDAIRTTRDVALGDVDNDGDLDLVCGNDGDVNTFYVNKWDEGNLELFSDVPACTSESANRTFGVALGDIGGGDDGGPDGYLDVVCGNVNVFSTLYFYDEIDTIFVRSAAWIPDRAGVTRDVVLGDIDLDGDLDLLCGNNQGQTNTLYVNEWSDGNQSVFSNGARWESGPAKNTFAIALGDIDGDGALELLCATDSGGDRSNTLYDNLSVSVDSVLVWESEPQNSSFGVALGDVTGDGYLDAAFGNGRALDQSNTVYENGGRDPMDWQVKYDGVFPENPKWELDPAGSRTIGVALADFDGDGALDLASGNAGAPNTIHWNNDGQLGSEVWVSGDYASTVTVVAGDVDGDGDLDLVCGNGGESNQKNTLYLNTDGRFFEADTIAWESTGYATVGVALGDVDGDGDLDLVCGNNNAWSNTLYLNDGSDSLFAAKPDWESNFKRDTFGVAFGDVDGDGDLDLVCGNAGTADQANTLYLNVGFPDYFTGQPVWESERTDRSTFGVALCDIDGDGDLDLACGNGGTDIEKNTLYLNVGFPDYFTAQPVWESDTADKTFGVAAGDVDNDGDVDLMFANAGTAGQSNMLYLGRKDPVFKGDPSSPERSTPNNAAHIVNVRVTPQIGEGDMIDVSFVAIDAESDPVWIVPEYQYEGEGSQGWRSLRDARNAGLVGLLNTSPDGVEHSFEWDTFLLTFDPRPVVLRLRVVEVPQTVSVMRHIASYVKPIGPIAPTRPEIKVAPRVVEFPAVCQCGDTSAVVTIANTGTDTLEVYSITFELASDEKSAMTIEQEFPFDVQPGSEVDVEILFKPHPDRVTPDSVVVLSDDPITLQDILETRTNVISLTSTRIPDDEKVDSNQDVDIYILSVPDGTSYVGGHLKYWVGGEREWDDSLSLVGMPPTATIPGDEVGSRGVQYRVSVDVAIDTTILTLSDPPCDPFLSFQVKVGGLQFPYGLPHDRYRMISIPLDLHDQPIVGVIDELGSSDPKKWRLWGYYNRHVDHYYHELPMYKKNFEQGRGYWLVTRNGGLRLNTSPAVGSTAPTDTAFVIHINRSWNMIGNPFHFNVAWDSVRVGADSLTMEEALQQGLIQRPRRWLHEDRTYNNAPVRVLVPFDGYFVYSFVDTELALYIPPDETPPETALIVPADRGAVGGAGAPTNSKKAVGGGAPGEWIVRIGASSAGVTDPFNYIGVKEGARSAWDPNDLSEPPGPPGALLSLYFPHNGWDHHRGYYTTDIRGDYQSIGAQFNGVASFSDDASGHVWNFDVATNLSSEVSGDPIHLEFSGIDQVPGGAEVILADRRLNKIIDLREHNSYDFYQANEPFVRDDNDARFVVLVGGDNFVDPETKDLRKIPTKTVLRTNYPNPFNPITIVRYELARSGRVTLRIYDVNGKLVKVLVDRNREPGYYEIGWDATNERGGPVSSGVYFYRFEADGIVQTRKMVFLK